MQKYFIALFMLLALGAGCTASVDTTNEQTNTGNDTPGDETLCKDRCGDGVCAEMTCQGTGCACAETAESCPQDCAAPDESEDVSDFIQVTSPIASTTLTSPLTIHGKARGTWYFEASFPVKVYDADGKLLGTGIAQAQGDWMTEDFVPFTTIIEFTKPTTATGTIVFEKDNPSGLPENDKSLTVDVTFQS